MTNTAIYEGIKERTGGDIYIGVVGPVRTGKSTFIKRFMETLVLPNIENDHSRKRATDEMPQSAGGRTVMTTEPKFVPEEACAITLGGNISFRCKMIDCVGYLVADAMGVNEDGKERSVHTPWSKEAVPFTVAAETGTRKVIREHSTIGIVVTTDGSISEIDRSSYLTAEERVINELKEINKPFAILLNSAHPESEESILLAQSLEDKYGAPVALVDCTKLDIADIEQIMGMILSEFPVSEISLDLPGWILALDESHRVYKELRETVLECAGKISKMQHISACFEEMRDRAHIEEVRISNIDLGCGAARVCIELEKDLYYGVLSELTGLDIADEESMITRMIELADIKKRYDRISGALRDVEEKGYGIVTPDIDELHFEEPEIIKHPGGYGVKLRAHAPSLHIIRANIETEINPTVGTEQQSQDLIKYLLNEYEEDPKKIWDSNIFGKTMYELVSEGLNSKLENMPSDARQKLSDTLERIINEGSGGLICIIL